VYSIRLELEVEAELQDARLRWARTDDAWEMIEWVLARDPTKGSPVSESGLARSFVFDGSRAHEMPTIQIVYVFESTVVSIKSARFSEPTYTAGTA
jgi:hypothetical protein